MNDILLGVHLYLMSQCSTVPGHLLSTYMSFCFVGIELASYNSSTDNMHFIHGCLMENRKWLLDLLRTSWERTCRRELRTPGKFTLLRKSLVAFAPYTLVNHITLCPVYYMRQT